MYRTPEHNEIQKEIYHLRINELEAGVDRQAEVIRRLSSRGSDLEEGLRKIMALFGRHQTWSEAYAIAHELIYSQKR